MSTETDRFRSLVSSVEIQHVRLVEAHVFTKIRSPQSAGTIELEIEYSADSPEQQDNGIFFIPTTLEVRVVPKNTKDKPVVSIKVTFELKYKLPQEFAATLQELTLFARRNGVFNAWPYCREFVQNTLARMNLPQLTIPLFKKNRPPQENKDEASQGEKSPLVPHKETIKEE